MAALMWGFDQRLWVGHEIFRIRKYDGNLPPGMGKSKAECKQNASGKDTEITTKKNEMRRVHPVKLA
ncbi:MAG: hypothetical protein LAT83_05220 [Kiritimatiellae bacterium]|nr:hypothetical protein [Kiritimatiellia bacterium]